MNILHTAIAFAALIGLLASQTPAMGQSVKEAVDTSPVPGLDVSKTETKLFALSQLLLTDPGRPEHLLLKGVYLTELGRLRAAFDIFDSLRTDFPEHPAPYANLAAVYARWGRLEDARQMLLKSDALTGNRHLTQMNLASVNLALALAALNKASELKPDDVGTKLKLRSLEKYLADSSAPRAPDRQPQEDGVSVSAEPTSTLPPISRGAITAAPNPNRTPKATEAPRDRLKLGSLDDGNRQEANHEASSEVGKHEPPSLVGKNDRSTVVKAIEAWTEAWAKKSYDDYIACYSTRFQPNDGGTRDSWARRKQDLLDKAKYIQLDVKISDIQIERSTATVRLTQKYRSNRYRDQVTKELKLQLENSRWLILAETQIN